MIKYIPKETSIVFEEVPGEVTLALNISNCQNRCEGCHSPHLRCNIGEELTTEVLDELIKKNEGITCVCFMGEGNDKEALQNLISYLNENYLGKLKIGLYSGREAVDEDFYWNNLNYLKIGPYKPDCGPLNKETTNQRMYFGGKYYSWCVPVNGKIRYGWTDITNKFWKSGKKA